MRPRTMRLVKRGTPLLLLALVIPLSVSSSQAADSEQLSAAAALHLSSGVVSRHYLMHPQDAPEELRPGYEAAAEAIERAKGAGGSAADVARPASGAVRFNRDTSGLPQNEESVSACGSRPDVVLGGTNDYRGLLNPRANFTGWHLSTNGGKSLANEGLLPAVRVFGKQVPSGGDPVDVATYDCKYLYAASLNYDPADPFGKPSAIGVYRTTPKRLAACAGGDAPACWPVRRAVAQTKQKGHFLDKEWMAVGRSGDAGEVVWVTYSDFDQTPTPTAEFTGAAIHAVRCTADLSRCTRPIKISGNDPDVQFSDVTIDPRGRTYITWSEIQGELEGTPQTFIHKLRVAEPGSTTFGPTRVVHRETKAIPFGGKLHAGDFRIATYPKNTVKIVNGKPRIFVTWEACRVRVLDFVCEDAQIKLTYSDDSGRTWSSPQVVSVGDENYFPTISKDPNDAAVTLAYFTSRFDPVFHNRQDVELVRVDSRSARVTERTRVTPVSNEPEADPLLGGSFIGDYIEVTVAGSRTYVHFNANYVPVRLLGTGEPIPQQDNFLARTSS
jgi:hypothetical protein